MPICIHCRYPIATLYTSYSKADDRALGKGVRLTQCPRCKRFADKYVEHDFVVLFIDLVLIKPEVYRHLLGNRLGGVDKEDGGFDRSIVRLGVLLLLFDVYLTWARIEKLSLPPSSPLHPHHFAHANRTVPPEPTTNAALLQAQPLILQYLFFLLLVTLSTLAFHIPIRLLCSSAPQRLPSVVRRLYRALVPYYPHPTPLSTALLVSSCTKLFPILLIIWDYDLQASATAVSWAVIVNNVAALEILMDCGYVRAGVLVGVGAAMRTLVSGSILRSAGLGDGWSEIGVEAMMQNWGEVGRWIGGLVDKMI
ncbi:hypothetical protein P280DRAFT_433512 [Massarina eburnea CBS 473.64]|uniref:Protein ARV n=1 Tax=Massarina eburnea CBS 473.64 TaxID=1395130 RepID=A0A6A6RTA8_9PLEO|nr:hypothetical protein P280DRAFT_433512 [Massarina eburnea CBS 473.64]